MLLFGIGKKAPVPPANFDPRKAEFVNANGKFLACCGREFLRIALALKDTRGMVTVEQHPEIAIEDEDKVLYAWLFRDENRKQIILPYLHFDQNDAKRNSVVLTVRGIMTRYEKGLFISIFEKTDIEVRFTDSAA